jgi:chromosome segregation ATPase
MTPPSPNTSEVGMQIVNELSRPAFQREAEREIDWLHEQIDGAKQDVRDREERAEEIRRDLPKLERELLVCERDAAEYKLKIIELRAKLDAKLGGAK